MRSSYLTLLVPDFNPFCGVAHMPGGHEVAHPLTIARVMTRVMGSVMGKGTSIFRVTVMITVTVIGIFRMSVRALVVFMVKVRVMELESSPSSVECDEHEPMQGVQEPMQGVLRRGTS